MAVEKKFKSRLDFSKLKDKIDAVHEELGNVIIGQRELIDLILVAFLSNGHILIEGVPGIAKTLIAKLLAKCTNEEFSRIQFTPDLMPSDVLGTSVFNVKSSEFDFKKGPIFSNIVLIDEINRSPAKTQAALFEVMEEQQITIDGNTYQMEAPFIVMATQNPIEHEGTYKLPEAQLDRFFFKINAGYPNLEEEILILERFNEATLEEKISGVKKVISKKEWTEFQKLVAHVHAEKKLVEYIAKIIHETRISSSLYLGGSPRASLALLNGAKGYAALNGRDFITPDDVKYISNAALSHRLILTAEVELEGLKIETIIQQILDKIEIPR
jgi:MoxR-like ATPase